MAGTDTYAAVAKPDDIARRWPDGREMPTLIGDVTRYIADKPWMSLGATRMVGDRMDDYWIESGADLWRDFGIFMRLPDGSRVAQWFAEGQQGEPLVVLIGSEGELEVLASSLEAFFATWALASFDGAGALVAHGDPVNLPSDLIADDDDDVPNGRPALAVFLTQRLGRDAASFLARKPDGAAFKSFFEDWGVRERAAMAANPHLVGMAQILFHHAPRGKDVWVREHFHVAVIGERVEIGSKGDPRVLIKKAEADALRPLILAERERRAQGLHSVRGLWHSAAINLHSDGSCQLNVNWDAAPKFFVGHPATAVEFAAELSRYPKSARWIEPWMIALPGP